MHRGGGPHASAGLTAGEENAKRSAVLRKGDGGPRFLQKIKEISPQDGSEVCKKNKIFQKIRIFIWLVTGKNVYLGHYNLA